MNSFRTLSIYLFIHASEAFLHPIHSHHEPLHQLYMSTATTGEATGEIRASLKKMRGVSISVEFRPEHILDSNEMEILSQELRKAKSASIWTSDIHAIEYFSREQSTARGNFPGPCPVVFTGNDIKSAVESGATAVLLNAGDANDADLEIGVDVIYKIESVKEMNNIIASGFDYAFFLSESMDNNELAKILELTPKSSVLISSLSSMQEESAEIPRAKELAAFSSELGTKVSGVLMTKACVGDAEDLKYVHFVTEQINKKSSSTFSMTGLTGATNGHFGSEISGGNQSAKWRRKE